MSDPHLEALPSDKDLAALWLQISAACARNSKVGANRYLLAAVEAAEAAGRLAEVHCAPRITWGKDLNKVEAYDWSRAEPLAAALCRRSAHKLMRKHLEAKIPASLWFRRAGGAPMSARDCADLAVAMHRAVEHGAATLTLDALALWLPALSSEFGAEFHGALAEAGRKHAEGRVWTAREGVAGKGESEAVRKLHPFFEYLRKKKALPADDALAAALRAKAPLARGSETAAEPPGFSAAELARKPILEAALKLDDAAAWMAMAPLCGTDRAESLAAKVPAEDWRFGSGGAPWLAKAVSEGALACAAKLLEAGANPWTAAASFDPKNSASLLSDAGPNPIYMGAQAAHAVLRLGEARGNEAQAAAVDRSSTFASSLFAAALRDAEAMEPGLGLAALARACSGARAAKGWPNIHPQAKALFDALEEEWEINRALDEGAEPAPAAPRSRPASL